MKAYTVIYRLSGHDTKKVSLLAKNKSDAYDKAVYEIIHELEGELPYAAWVDNVTFSNGNVHYFNTHEGNPY